jgi:hypothetical protein
MRRASREDTLVVFTSDHGELLGAHGRMQKSTWHEESVGVPGPPPPAGPRSPASPRFPSPTAPTFPTGFAPEIAPPRHKTRSLTYFAMRDTQLEARGGDVACGWRGLRTIDTSYVVTRDRHTGALTHLRYDLVADPLQLHPETSPGVLNPDLAARLRARLDAVADPFASLL